MNSPNRKFVASLTILSLTFIGSFGCTQLGPKSSGLSDPGSSAGTETDAVVWVTRSATNPCDEQSASQERLKTSVLQAVIGGAIGLTIGTILDKILKDPKHTGAKVGAAAGVFIGAMRGYNEASDVARRQCALFKETRARNAEAAFALISTSTPNRSTETAGELTVPVDTGYFVSGG